MGGTHVHTADWTKVTCRPETGGLRGTVLVLCESRSYHCTKFTLTMAGTGLDDPGVYYSDPFFSDDRSEAEGELSRTTIVNRLKEFIKTFMDHTNSFCYRYLLGY